ncbi:hypothetical protein GCM10027187_33180 [Streptosporangium sandarakinum]
MAPARTKPAAIMRPMPREPPVTTTVLPSTENRVMFCSMPYRRLHRPRGPAPPPVPPGGCEGRAGRPFRAVSNALSGPSVVASHSHPCAVKPRLTGGSGRD